MSTEANEAVVRRLYEEMWNRGEFAVADELIAPTETHHAHGRTVAGGPEAQTRAARAFRKAFPDNHLTLEVVVSGGDLVAARWRIAATHADTGARITDYVGVNIFRIVDGQIVEIWDTRDDLGLFSQLGLIPPVAELMAQVYAPIDA
jgi:predicted SnoaL-like aldol condensation-catalyzing enzyme